jgi:hypothetical protein
MHLTAPSNWSRSIGTGGRDPSEQVVTIAGMRNIPKLVNDQELVSGELPLQAKQSFLVASFQQLMNESRGGIEAN